MKQKDDFTKIKKILKWVWENPYSSFYRDKYQKAGIESWRDIKNLEDFNKLPYLTRDELIKAGPFNFMFLPLSKAAGIALSSGTTGSPLILFRPAPTFKAVRSSHIRFYPLLIKYNAKRWLTLLGPSAMNRLIYTGTSPSGLCQIVGDATNFPLTAIIAARTKIQAIDTTPTLLQFFMPYLKEKYDLTEIKIIRISGEYCSKTRLQLLKSFFQKARFLFTYSSTETIAPVYECDYIQNIQPNLFHLGPYHYLELINPATSIHVDNYQPGEIIVTHLFKTIAPLIRYKTGDLAVFEKLSCRCGKTDPALKVLGRANFDSLKIQGTTLHINTVETALARVQDLIENDYKIHVYEHKIGSKLLVKLRFEVIKRNVGIGENQLRALLVDKISKYLYLSPKFTLADLINQGLFLKPEITFVNSFPFEVKQKRIISHLE